LGARSAGSAAFSVVPARDVFVGRDMELGQLEAMLSAGNGRIVTITGPGGVGKSRMARELAKRTAGCDGVAWVALSDLTAATDALPLLAEQIGLTLDPRHEAKPQVIAALTLRQSLIVLDNAEHLDGLPQLLNDLQHASPRSTWLVTSSAPLALAKERTYTLEGMDGPEPGEVLSGVEQALTFDAMRLLESRASALNPDFDMCEHWVPCLDLVRAAGGWPLAIEMAAGAVAHHGVEAVLADLSRSIDTLAASQAPKQAHHDSMRASLALSWRLLGPDEQNALAALSVFRGGFSHDLERILHRSNQWDPHGARAGQPRGLML
jgi:predicted ATPase